jgi:hypothetical protein
MPTLLLYDTVQLKIILTFICNNLTVSHYFGLFYHLILFFCIIFFSTGLFSYKPILNFILDSRNIGDNENDNNSSTNKYNNLTRRNSRTKEFYENNKNGNLNKSFNGFENTKMAPILSILNIVRKSLRKFLVSPNDFREARSVMMKVFRNFDPQEKNKMTPRDFSFAVSVLINEIREKDGNTVSSKSSQDNLESSSKFKISSPAKNLPKNAPWRVGTPSPSTSTRENYLSSRNNTNNINNYNNNNNNTSTKSYSSESEKNKSDPRNILCSDVPILTSEDWNLIFQYFANNSSNKLNNDNKNDNKNGSINKSMKLIDISIDYEKFCDLVLNQEEIKKMSLSSNFKNLGKSLNKSVDLKSRKLSSSHFNLDDVSTAASRVRASSATRKRLELNSR